MAERNDLDIPAAASSSESSPPSSADERPPSPGDYSDDATGEEERVVAAQRQLVERRAAQGIHPAENHVYQVSGGVHGVPTQVYVLATSLSFLPSGSGSEDTVESYGRPAALQETFERAGLRCEDDLTDKHFRLAAKLSAAAVVIMTKSKPGDAERPPVRVFLPPHASAQGVAVRRVVLLGDSPESGRTSLLCVVLPPGQRSSLGMEGSALQDLGTLRAVLAISREAFRSVAAGVILQDHLQEMQTFMRDPVQVRRLNWCACEDISKVADDSSESSNREKVAAEVQRVLLKFQRLNPHLSSKLVAQLTFVSCFIGSTSVGKDKLVERILNIAGVAMSGRSATTRIPEQLSSSYDPKVSPLADGTHAVEGDLDLAVYASEHSTGRDLCGLSLTELAQERAQVHRRLAERDTFGENPLFIALRTSDPEALTRCFLNFPGFVTFVQNSDPGGRLFQVVDDTASTMNASESGALFVVRKANEPVANEYWKQLRVICQEKLNIPVVFVLTFGDLINVPTTCRTFAEMEDVYFGEVRAIVPSARCFLVANWSEDSQMHQPGTPTADFGANERAALERNVERMVQVVRDNNQGTDYLDSPRGHAELKHLRDHMGTDKLLKFYAALAAKHVIKPLVRFAAAAHIACLTLLEEGNRDLATLQKLDSGTIGRDFQRFAECMTAQRPAFFLGRALPCEAYKESLLNAACTAEEEFVELLTESMFGALPELSLGGRFCASDGQHLLWREQLAWADSHVDNKQATHFQRVARLRCMVLRACGEQCIADVSDDYVHAATERHSEGNVQNQERTLLQHVLRQVCCWLQVLAKFVAAAGAQQVLSTVRLQVRCLLQHPDFAALRMDGPRTCIENTVSRVYGRDVHLYLMKKLRGIVDSVCEVDLEGAGIPRKTGGADNRLLGGFDLLGHAQRRYESKKDTVPNYTYKLARYEVLQELFVFQSRAVVQTFFQQALAETVSRFQLRAEMTSMGQARVFLKHLVMTALKPEQLLAGLVQASPHARDGGSVVCGGGTALARAVAEGQCNFPPAFRIEPGELNNGYQLTPPAITEENNLREIHLLGFLPDWRREQPFVLTDAYHTEPTDTAVTTCKRLLDEHFNDTYYYRLELFDRMSHVLEQAGYILGMLFRMKGFLERVFPDVLEDPEVRACLPKHEEVKVLCRRRLALRNRFEQLPPLVARLSYSVSQSAEEEAAQEQASVAPPESLEDLGLH